ncbi:MAG TPA: Coenzyme F420 hydrogenase/dehydrogenase, beta subunit C-terminal domain [Clostridia bacterium]|nr:Coenzyme F420 hydrogenase/dehydrogenase, beta subunit C-terminal domain [Clostridia bacterium]
MREIIKEARLCTGCTACRQVCPRNAITMSANEEGFLYPSIDAEICNDCGLCEKTCPVNTATGFKIGAKPAAEVNHKVYACYSTDETVRSKSTSGGVFTQLALMTLSDGGVVFGAGFDDEFKVTHIYAEDEKQLDNLRRSKYVQSNMADAFAQAGEFLKAGRKVLFCGMPCQIAGLKAFLKRDYEGLLTCDLACHGVPSPRIWDMFLKYLKDTYKSEIKSVSFRDKSTGWNDSSMRVEFKNGSRYIDRVKREIYSMGFGKSIFNRSSCYDCKFRISNTKADITLADFWGIDRHGEKEYSDNKGVSLVIIHTGTGEEALKRISGNICIKERSLDEAVRFNPRLVSSVAEPAGRKEFFNDLKAGQCFDQLRAKYMDNKSFKYKAKCLAKRILGRT